MTGAAEISRAERLRLDFDASFASPLREAEESRENLLAVAIGGDPYAIRLGEISELAEDLPITPFPARDTAFLGVATHRGRVLPVFGLAEILGHPPAARPRWVVMTAIGGLAFERYDGPLRARPGDFAAGVVRDKGIIRTVLDLPEIERRVRTTHARPARAQKEE